MPIFSVIVTTGGMTFKTGMEYAAANFAILETEITNARGSASSLAARLGVSLNQDGSLIGDSTVAVDWKTSGYTAVKVDASTFKVTDPDTDLTALLAPGRCVRFNNDGSALYGVIKTSSFAASETTCITFDTNIPATITQLDYGIIAPYDGYSPLRPVWPRETWAGYAAPKALMLYVFVDTGRLVFMNPITENIETISVNPLPDILLLGG